MVHSTPDWLWLTTARRGKQGVDVAESDPAWPVYQSVLFDDITRERDWSVAGDTTDPAPKSAN